MAFSPPLAPSSREVPMPPLAPPTLTADEQKEILRVTAANVRDYMIFSVALGIDAA